MSEIHKHVANLWLQNYGIRGFTFIINVMIIVIMIQIIIIV